MSYIRRIPMVLNARVVAIESGEEYVDKLRRITLKFLDGDPVFNKIRLAIDAKIFGTYEPKLNDVVCFESVGILDESSNIHIAESKG
jgi:hypothetical protein